METLALPKLLLIAGTGRNSGKTTLACNIIQQCSKTNTIIAIKISSHFHTNIESSNILINRENLYISEETNALTHKDSSKMLATGARKSFFVMAGDEQQFEALQFILKLVNANDYIICESGGLRKWIVPGIFLILHHIETLHYKANIQYLKPLCDQWITFDGNNIDFDINTLTIADNCWQIIK